jgi:hypothetical protein
MAEAAASRPKIVGDELNKLARQDPEILQTVLEVMEVEQLLASDVTVDIVPAASPLLVQMGERPRRERAVVVSP